MSVANAAPAIWLVTFLCCGFGSVYWYRQAASIQTTIAPATAPLILLFPAFWNGLTNYQLSTTPDTWNYIAVGQYLWNHSTFDATGPLVPLYQYARGFAGQRIVGVSLLDFFSFLFGPGDSQLAYNLLIAFTIFAIAAAAMAIASGLRLSWRWSALLVGLIVLSGWIDNIILVGNLDQLLSLPYLMAGIAVCLNHDTKSIKEALILGLVVAASLTTYIELAPLIIIEITIVLVYTAITRGTRLQEQLRFYSVMVLSGVVFIGLNWRSLEQFFLGQVRAAFHDASRPGEYVIHELIVPSKAFVTFWGFGAEWLGNLVTPTETVAAILLAALLALGVIAVIRARRFDFIVLLVAYAGGMAYFAFDQRYGYGAYKIMIYTWWLICVCLTFGLKLLSRFLNARMRWILLPLLLIPCVRLLGPVRNVALQPTVPSSQVARLPMTSFRTLETLSTITRGLPVCVVVNDWLANLWAVYYTRNMPMALGAYRMHMALQPQLLDASQQPDLENIRMLLVDASETFDDLAQWSLVKTLPPYRLFRSNSERWALITGVKNDNGVGQVDGKSFMWLGSGITEIDILTNRDGEVQLSGTGKWGPSVTGKATRDVRVVVNGSDALSAALSDGPLAISIPVHKGRSAVCLMPTDKRTASPLPDGDSRPLNFGIGRLTITPSVVNGVHVLPIEVRNPYHVDNTDLGPLYWMGTDPTEIRFYCEHAGQAELRAQFLPGPSVVGTSKRSIMVTAGTYKQVLTIEQEGDRSVKFPARAGLNTVKLLGLDKPNIMKLSNGDPRKLIVGLMQVEVDEVDATTDSKKQRN